LIEPIFAALQWIAVLVANSSSRPMRSRRPHPAPARACIWAIREAIISRRLAPGTALPPTRTLAADLALGRNTVVRVYDQLIVEGYLDSRVGSGTFVSDAVAVTAPQQKPRRMVGARSEGLSKRGVPDRCRCAVEPGAGGGVHARFPGRHPLSLRHLAQAGRQADAARTASSRPVRLRRLRSAEAGARRIPVRDPHDVVQPAADPDPERLAPGARPVRAHARRRRRRGVDGRIRATGGRATCWRPAISPSTRCQ
jgi:hypothetical protein